MNPPNRSTVTPHPSGSAPEDRVDVVYTWVDGAFPGYAELLQQYSTRPVDLNPNRFRDNLEILRFSFRSLECHAPWRGRVHLVTMRPQLPAWLDPDAPGLQVVHHDMIFDPKDLPTFNSLSILSNIHRIPGLSRRFIIMEDDCLFGSPVSLEDFFSPDGRPLVYEKRRRSDPGSTHLDPKDSVWREAVAFSNHLLDERYGVGRRGDVDHVPVPVEMERWLEMLETWPEGFRHTRGSRFRSPRNIAPEHLYPHFLLQVGAGVRAPWRRVVAHSGYLGLMNSSVLMGVGLAYLRVRKPKFLALNDSFGPSPNPRVVRSVCRFLASLFPRISAFEKDIQASTGSR